MGKKVFLGFVAIDNNKVEDAMDKKGFSNVFVATVLGVDKTSVSNWKNGNVSSIAKAKYDALCALLDCDVKADPKPEPVKEEPKEDHGRYPWGKSEEKAEPIKLEAQVVPQTDISKMFGRIMDLQMKQLEEEREANKELREMLKTAIDALNDVAGRDTAALSEITIEAVNDDFRQWRQNVMRCANKVISMNKTFKSTNSVLSEAYKLLRNQYGIVWEQDKKDFLDKNGRAPVSTLELEYWIETTKPSHKNLLVAKLDTLCHKDYYGKTKS